MRLLWCQALFWFSQNEPGEFSPFILRAKGLELLGQDALDLIQLKLGHPGVGDPIGFHSLHKEETTGVVFLEDPEHFEQPVIVSMAMIDSGESVLEEQVDELLLKAAFMSGIDEPLTFQCGIFAGLGLAIKDLVVGTGEIAADAIAYGATARGVQVLEYSIKLSDALGGDTRSAKAILNVFQSELDDTHEEWRQLAVTCYEAAEFVRQHQQEHAEFVVAWLQGDIGKAYAKAAKISETNELAMMIAAELVGILLDEIDAADDFEKGVFCGRIIFEILALIIPYTKAGALTHVKKIEMLDNLQANIPKLGKKGKGISAAVFARMASYIQKLRATKMCFVAGTLVATPLGLQAIETLQAGDLVLARSEQTNEQAWRPISETFKTHPPN